jgi:hypothetical protein
MYIVNARHLRSRGSVRKVSVTCSVSSGIPLVSAISSVYAESRTVYIYIYIYIYIVAHRAVVKRELCKQRPFLGHGSVNTLPRQRICTQQ